MKLFIIILTTFYVSCMGSSSTQEDDSNEGDNDRLYMDALVCTMELLFALKGNIRYISTEFERIHYKLGINISEDRKLLTESDNMLERDIQELQTKFQGDLIRIVAVNPLKTKTVDTISKSLDTLKQRAAAMENQYCHEMVEEINSQVDQGKSDIYKFQDDIQDIMRQMEAVAATAPATFRRMGRVFRTTEQSIF